MNNNLLPIAKEGWSYIQYTLAAFVVFLILDLELLTFITLLALAFLVFVFRNPERELPNFEHNSVLSPVDGVVEDIKTLEDDSEYAYRVTLKSTHLDVSILRSPLSATVIDYKKSFGANLNFDSKLAKQLNENVNVIFKNSDENQIKVSHYTQESFSGVSVDNIKAKNLIQSARYGVMISGITYIYLPQNFRLNIKENNKVTASQSLIGYFS